MKLLIKNMVSLRCKLVVKATLERLGIPYIHIDLGEVTIPENLTESLKGALAAELLVNGFDLLEDRKSILIEKIKNVIIEMVHYSEEPPETNFSTFLSSKLNYDYHYLSNLFSAVKGITIEQFIIIHKIERVKELIIYNELTLTEIAYKMHYSSVAHLSNQFKKVTGLTPSFFKNMKNRQMNNRSDL